MYVKDVIQVYDKKTAKILYDGELAEQKKYIMDNFNFYKVQRVMCVMDWSYWDSATPPSITRLKKTASYLLDTVIHSPNDYAYTGTGGFQAEKIDGNFIILQFVFEEWSADNDDFSESD